MRSTFAVQNINTDDIRIELTRVGEDQRNGGFYTIKIEGAVLAYHGDTRKAGYVVDLYLDQRDRLDKAHGLRVLAEKFSAVAEACEADALKLDPPVDDPIREPVEYHQLELANGRRGRQDDGLWYTLDGEDLLCEMGVRAYLGGLAGRVLSQFNLVLSKDARNLPLVDDGAGELVRITKPYATDEDQWYATFNGIETEIIPSFYNLICKFIDSSDTLDSVYATIQEVK
jgi:hypothetical protein